MVPYNKKDRDDSKDKPITDSTMVSSFLFLCSYLTTKKVSPIVFVVIIQLPRLRVEVTSWCVKGTVLCFVDDPNYTEVYSLTRAYYYDVARLLGNTYVVTLRLSIDCCFDGRVYLRNLDVPSLN